MATEKPLIFTPGSDERQLTPTMELREEPSRLMASPKGLISSDGSSMKDSLDGGAVGLGLTN